ncbi:MAG TPA: hypothetical protein VJR89_21770 [Polyangiales bacterium]|nr:hypothetical protein [Polyangiales bacterium]
MVDTDAFATSPHLVDPARALGLWFTDPPGMVVRFLRRTTFTVPLAQWLAGPGCDGLRERFPGEESFGFVLDLHLMDGRDPAVRAIVVEAARPWASRARRAVVVPPEAAGRVYLASIRAAASLARVVGLTVSVGDFREAVRDLRVAARSTRASIVP